MKKTELKKLIEECINEVAQEQGMEEGWGRDMWKGLKKQVKGTFMDKSGAYNDGDPDARNAAHDKRADYLNAKEKDPEKAKQMRAAGVKELVELIEDYEENLRNSMRKSYAKAMAINVDFNAVRNAYQKKTLEVLQAYQRLEESKKSKK